MPTDEALHGLAELQCCEAIDTCDNPIVFQSHAYEEEHYRQLIPMQAITDNSDIAYFRVFYNGEVIYFYNNLDILKVIFLVCTLFIVHKII